MAPPFRWRHGRTGRATHGSATQPTSVGDIAATLALSSSLVSHHLRLLRAARILKAERQGKQVFYAAADAHISTLLATMFEHIAEPINGLDT